MNQRRSLEVDLAKALLGPLTLLILTEGPVHGWGIVQRLESEEIRLGDSSAVYRTLQDLERSKLVRSKWEATGRGPARRVYFITPKGRSALERESATAVQFVGRFDEFLRSDSGAAVRN